MKNYALPWKFHYFSIFPSCWMKYWTTSKFDFEGRMGRISLGARNYFIVFLNFPTWVPLTKEMEFLQHFFSMMCVFACVITVWKTWNASCRINYFLFLNIDVSKTSKILRRFKPKNLKLKCRSKKSKIFTSWSTKRFHFHKCPCHLPISVLQIFSLLRSMTPRVFFTEAPKIFWISLANETTRRIQKSCQHFLTALRDFLCNLLFYSRQQTNFVTSHFSLISLSRTNIEKYETENESYYHQVRSV